MSTQPTAIAALFTPVSMNAEQYDEIIRQLEAAGAGAPAGRLFHVAFGTGNNLRVLDLYDSPESFQAFGQTLMPILQKVGVEVGRPDVAPVQNVITALAGAGV